MNAKVSAPSENPALELPPNNCLTNIRANSARAEVDTIYRISEMNMSGRITRRALLAERLYDLVRVNGGTYDRARALENVAAGLGITVDEARYGINCAMGAGLLRYSVDGQQLLLA